MIKKNAFILNEFVRQIFDRSPKIQGHFFVAT